MADRFSDRMNQSDTTLWRIERDPRLRTTILGISILGCAPDWDQLCRRIDKVTDEIPRLRQRVADPLLGVGRPRWVPARGFDLDDHLGRIVAPYPGDLRAVLDLAEPMAMEAFDRSRPLWEFTLVEGLEAGRAALIQKVHHSVTDGVGAIRMARLLLDEHDDGSRPSRQSSSHGLLLDAATARAREALHQAQRAAHVPGAVGHSAVETVRHPARTARTLVGTLESIGKLVRPVRQPLSPIMGARGTSRRLATLEMSLDDLKAAGHAVDGTVNDAFLAAVTGGMRRYHERHGATVEALQVTMPVNVRTAGDTLGNNRFVPVRFVLPISEDDPRRRMEVLGEMARSWRREPGIKFTDVIAGVLNSLPGAATTAIMGSMLKAIDMVVTNVPGLESPAHLAGATVDAQYAFAPPSGSALSAALLSHVDRCTLGLVTDTAAVPDPEVLAACLADGFEEILSVGHPRVRR
jgi:WS/DGAT/MGAT family acyltransferase